MTSKLRFILVVGLIACMPVMAYASSYAAFSIHKGTQREAMADGTVPQAVITLVLSNSSTACADWLALDFRPNKQYLLTRLLATPTGDALTGCYDVVRNTSSVEGCQSKRGTLDGVEFFGAAKDEDAGRIKNSKFITGGHINVDTFLLNEDGTGSMKGFANVRLGDMATGGVIEAEWCREAAPEQALRLYNDLRD